MEILQKLKKNDFAYMLFLSVIALYPRLRYFFSQYYSPAGLPRANDTAWYIEHANTLLHSFKIDIHYNGIFYLGYYGLLALMLFVFKTEALVIFVQVLVNAFSVSLVYKIASIVFNRRAGIFAGLLYAFTWSVISWSMFILSDSFFISLLLLNVYFLLCYYKFSNRKYLYCFLISSFYMVFFRPTGIITLTFILLYIMINLNLKSAKAFLARRTAVLVSCFVILGGITVYVLTSGVLNSLFTSFKWSIMWILYTVYSNGQIFDVPTRFDYKFDAIKTVNYFDNFFISYFINNWYHIIVLYCRKAVFFWAFSLKDFLQHIKYQSYFIVAYFFSFIGLLSIFKQKLLKRASVLMLVILSIQIFCIVFFMDSSFRYRDPALVFLNMIAGFGIDRMISFGQAGLKQITGKV